MQATATSGGAFALRSYQQQTIDAVRDCYRAGFVAPLAVLATGTGKTVTFTALAHEEVAAGGRVLVVVPSVELAQQAAATARRMGLRAVLERRDERASADAEVVVATVQTLSRKVRLARFEPSAFTLVIFDEAAHAVASSWRAIRDHFSGARFLGVTATPDRCDGVALRQVFDCVAYTYGIREAIAEGYLVPIRMRRAIVESLDLRGVRSRGRDLDASQLADALSDRVFAEMAVVMREQLHGRLTIAFVPSVEAAHRFADILCRCGFAAEAIDGGMADEDRAAILERYRAGETQILVNVAILTEGFDAPATACIVNARPTKSRALFTQMVGRGTRLADGKDDLLVLDFTPNAGTHVLVSPIDVLGGDDLDPKVKAAADRIAAEAQGALDIEETIQRARQVVADEELAAKVRYQLEAIDPFAVRVLGLGVVPPVNDNELATPAQLAALNRRGIKPKHEIGRRWASVLISAADDRRARGLCTPKQAAFLEKRHLNGDVSFELAREAIEACRTNGWRTPDWMYRDPRFARRGAEEGAAA